MRDLGPVSLRNSSEFHIWQTMIARCTNPNSKDYPRYGGAGVIVSPRWLKSFPDFLHDVGVRPGPGYSLDRENNAKGYVPGNCRWATATEQNRNRSSNRLIAFEGKKITLAELAERTGVGRMTIAHRLNNGESLKQAVRLPHVRYSFQGEEKTLREWAEVRKLKYSTLYKRVVILRWPLAKALNSPA